MKGLVRRALVWAYWHPFKVIVQGLPFAFVYTAGRLASFPLYHLLRRRRRMYEEAFESIAHVLPAVTDGPSTVRKTFANWFCGELEVLFFPKLNAGNIAEVTRCEGLENLDAALSEGRGAMLLFAHFGPNQMVMPAIGYRGYRMCQMSAPPVVWVEKLPGRKFSETEKKALEIRWEHELSLPVRHINIFSSLKEAFLCLRRNEVLGIAIDGGGGQDRATVEFLGMHAQVSTGAMDIAMRTRCKVLPVFMLRGEDGLSTMVIKKPIEVRSKAEGHDALHANIEQFMGQFEKYVIEYPCHYINFLALRSFMEKQGDIPFLIKEKSEHESTTSATAI